MKTAGMQLPAVAQSELEPSDWTHLALEASLQHCRCNLDSKQGIEENKHVHEAAPYTSG
jgi:hypothetical protein